ILTDRVWGAVHTQTLAWWTEFIQGGSEGEYWVALKGNNAVSGRWLSTSQIFSQRIADYGKWNQGT
ncbi:hypothetical protein, partial [Glutamicibacter sp. BW77]|uniref:hypothetical protein n=1 Tax=Glutamicibacter sp. BW77 TaxID=2024402 RepID=UPI000BD92BE1